MDGADIEEMLSIDNDVSVVHPLCEGEIAEIVLNSNHDDDSNNTNNDIESSGEKKIYRQNETSCDQLTTGLKLCVYQWERDYGTVLN